MMRTPSHFLEHWHLYQRASTARTDREIQAAIAAFASGIGFSNYSHVVKYSASTQDHHAPDICVTNYDAEWDRYCRTLVYPWGETLDPDIMPAACRMPAFCWNSDGDCNAISSFANSSTARARRGRAAEFGIRSGLGIPLPTPGAHWAVVQFTSDVRLDPRELGQLLLTSAYFTGCLQTAVERVARSDVPAPDLTLTEKAVLQWSTMGKTSWEIGRILRLNERTVNYHVYRAAAKLGVKGRRAAAARAIALGLISI